MESRALPSEGRRESVGHGSGGIPQWEAWGGGGGLTRLKSRARSPAILKRKGKGSQIEPSLLSCTSTRVKHIHVAMHTPLPNIYAHTSHKHAHTNRNATI